MSGIARCALLVPLILIYGAPAMSAEAFSSPWAPGLKSSARLIAGDQGWAGVEIKLASGTLTYWRDPGDAGLPPSFEFSGSINVAAPIILYPAPKRIREPDGSQALGYEGSVIFPFAVTRTNPDREASLTLKLNYAVCEKICVPAEAKLTLTLPTQDGSLFAQAIAAARMATPRQVDAASLGGELIAISDASWRYCLAGPVVSRDLFIEPPQGWWIALKKESVTDRDCFALEAKQRPIDANLPILVRVTITGGDAPLETSVTLAAKP